MLKLRYGEQFHTPCVLLLGAFDGLHQGHERLLVEAKKLGFPVGLTSMFGGKEGGDVFTPSERESIFARAGLDFWVEIPFTSQFQSLSAEQFCQTLEKSFRLKAVFCGEDFRFGKGALGDIDLLKKRLSCPVTALDLQRKNGQKIATSSIKRAVLEGNMRSANELLCFPYFVQGEVERGRQVGRTYHFPTLNLSIKKEKVPLKEGVYGGYARTEKGEFPCIVNVGARPTFFVEEKKIEAYLEGFSEEIYGETVQIYPTEYYRPIEKFESAEQLQGQLQKDILRLKGERL